MKTIFISLCIISLMMINGCSKTPYIGFVPPPETTKEPPTEEPIKHHYEECYWHYYKVESVDTIFVNHCYALKQVNPRSNYDKYLLNKSLEFADWSYMDISDMFYNEKNMDCEYINTEGLAYCLRDNSTCLIIEDNKICNIINLSEFK